MVKYLIRRPVTVTMLMLVMVTLGMVSIFRLPVSLIPEVDIPSIMVRVSSENTSPSQMENGILRVLRGELMQINGLKNIECESSLGSGTIRMDFDYGTNLSYYTIEVNEKIDRCMANLPCDRPIVRRSGISYMPAFYVNVTSRSGSMEELSLFVENIVSKRLEQLEQVSMVDISGIVTKEILITPDRNRMRQYGLTISEIENAVKESDVHLGSLSITDGLLRYDVRFESVSSSADDIAALRIRKNGRIIQVRDVASVSTRTAERIGTVRSDGMPSVCMAVMKQAKSRMSDLKENVNTVMSDISEEFPDVSFMISRDQSELLEYSINNLFKNILAAVLLACIVISLFLGGGKLSVLVFLTIPTALMLSLFGFFILGISINIISLSGLLLGIGMMSDNTIILVDNITMKWKNCGILKEAVIEGTSSVMGPMFSSSLTTCAVFIPLVFMNGLAGDLFYDQAMAMTIVLMCSYLVTILIVPVYFFLWYGGKDPASVDAGKIRLNALLQKWDHQWLGKSLRHSSVSVVLLVISLIGAGAVFAYMPKSRLPEMAHTDAVIDIDWNENISLEENVGRVKRIEDEFGGEGRYINSFSGIQQFILLEGSEKISEASIYIKCGSAVKMEKTLKAISKFLKDNWNGCKYETSPSENVFDMVFSDRKAVLTARIQASGRLELQDFRELYSRITNNLNARFPEMLIPPIPVSREVLLESDPEMMALYSITPAALEAVLKRAMNSHRLMTLVEGAASLPVVVGTNDVSLKQILSGLTVESSDGREIPLDVILRQSFIEDFDAVRSGAEGIYYPLDLNPDAKDVPEVMDIIRRTVFGDGKYNVSFCGSWFDSRELSKEMTAVLLVSVILLFIILASQFESMVQPAIILSEIIIDIFFSLLAVWAVGVTINIMTLIGLVVITGIVINDSILKIDTINKLRRAGEELETSIFKASSQRVKAILMTSLTTIFAMVPFLSRGSVGDDLQYPLSLVVISGMTVGTLVSLFIVPALYYIVYRHRDKNRWL